VSSRGPSLFVTHSSERGGAGRFLVDVVAGLPGPAVVACPPGPVADACRARGVPVVLLRERPLNVRGGVRTSLGGGAALAGHAREIRRLVRDLEPAVVFTWGMRSALAAAAALTGQRNRPPWLARHHDFVPGPLIAAVLRRALSRADDVLVNSRAVRDDLRLGRPVEVILPGVDLGHFAPAAGARRAGLLWLGAIVAWKRPDLALEVAARTPGTPIRLAGAPLDAEGERLLADLRTRAAAQDLEGRVDLPGTVDPAEALAAAEALLHTADREPFGIAVAEALASGVPVVAAAAGGPAEVVDDTCGRLFPPGDAGRAAEAVAEVLADRAALAEGARRRAEELLDLERARGRFAALLARHRAGAATEEEAGAELALVTVTHNSAAELDALLRSVARHLPAAQVVVADSGSSDDSLDVARRHGAEAIELDNAGYGAAANAGLAAVTRPITAILNPDVELVDGSLAQLAAELARPSAARRILVPAVVLPDGSRQDVAQHEPATLPAAVLALVPPALIPPPLRTAIEPWRARRPRRAGWAVGACLAGPTETLRALGPFDPEIFLYAEDLDLGLRAADAGVETWFWPAARVLHRRAHSTRRAFGGEPFELLARRRRAVIEARRGRGRARLDDILQALTFADRIALKALARRDTTRERRQLAALRAARRSP
jgi:GT2 family glycosyltransferase/glycosyltransferase involved in cell wall biosynthesis